MPENSAEPVEAIRRARPIKLWISEGVTVALLALGLLALVQSAKYDELPWWSHPKTLHACGREFIDGGSESRAQILAGGDRLIRVGSVPGWFNHGELWTTTVGEPLDGTYCHVVMWVRTGRDGFESYSLSGGP